MKPLKLDDGESRIAENAFREEVGNQEKEEGEPKTFPPSWAWILSVQQSYFPALRPPPARTLVLSAIMGGTSAGQAEGVCRAMAGCASFHTGGDGNGLQAKDQIKSRPCLYPHGSGPAGGHPGSPSIPDHAGEPLKYGRLFLGLLPVPPWCHFQIHYIPMALGSFNYM